MGLTLTLTDQELPASPAFIEFLYATLNGDKQYVGQWFRQDEEGLHSDSERFADIQQKADKVIANPKGAESVLRSYRFFKELLTGRPDCLRDVTRFRFFFVIGIPRTGGTYLTKQLFRAGGIDYSKVQNSLAHDGFPHLAHLSFKEAGNLHTTGLLQLAEYLTMVELFFGKHARLAYQGGVVVPKKFTKAIYYFDLIRELFGEQAHYLITLRHPLAITQSILDKSGGMPQNRKFALRSAIERWALDDWLHWGATQDEIEQMNYVDCFLGYWKRFHYQLALAGVPRMATAQIVPYGEKYMTEAAAGWFKKFGIKLEPEKFKVAKAPTFLPAEHDAANAVVNDVARFWDSLGLTFPVKELTLGQ